MLLPCVTTKELLFPDFIDVLSGKVAKSITVEIWYPSDPKSSSQLAVYNNELRSGQKFSMQGNAYRDLEFLDKQEWPLVVMSHGYTGYRSIMFYLGEHLASHGFVVVAIDHTDSTNAEVDYEKAPFSGFPSTLVNRSRDQQLILDYFAESENVTSVFGSKAKWKASIAGITVRI